MGKKPDDVKQQKLQTLEGRVDKVRVIPALNGQP